MKKEIKKIITLKDIEKTIRILESAKNLCPQCNKLFGSNPKKSGFVVYKGIGQLWCKKCLKKLMKKETLPKEIENLINYAYKNGFIGDEVFEWTEKQKQDYYNKCMTYEPEILGE